MFKNYYETIIGHDLINKYSYKNTNCIVKVNKLMLDIDFKGTPSGSLLASSLLFMEVLLSQNPKKKKLNPRNYTAKLKKGQIIGYKVTLRKKKALRFIEELYLNPTLTSSRNKIKCSNGFFQFEIKNILKFKGVDNYYRLFKNVPPIQITIIFNNVSKSQNNFMLKSLKIK